jgi:hypothetical protein
MTAELGNLARHNSYGRPRSRAQAVVVNQVPPIPEASKCQPFRVQEPTPPRSRNLGGVGKLHGARGMELPSVARLRSLALLGRSGSSRGRPKASCVHPSGQSPETSEDAASAAPQLSGFEPLPPASQEQKTPEVGEPQGCWRTPRSARDGDPSGRSSPLPRPAQSLRLEPRAPEGFLRASIRAVARDERGRRFCGAAAQRVRTPPVNPQKPQTPEVGEPRGCWQTPRSARDSNPQALSGARFRGECNTILPALQNGGTPTELGAYLPER